MGNEFKSAYDQVTLSPAADARIRAALEKALAKDGNVIELHVGGEHLMKRKTRK